MFFLFSLQLPCENIFAAVSWKRCFRKKKINLDVLIDIGLRGPVIIDSTLAITFYPYPSTCL